MCRSSCQPNASPASQRARRGASLAGYDLSNSIGPCAAPAVYVVGPSAGSAPGTGAISPSGQSAARSAATRRNVSKQLPAERVSGEPACAGGGASLAGYDLSNSMRAVYVVGPSAGSAPGPGAISPSGQSAARSAATRRNVSKQLPAERVSGEPACAGGGASLAGYDLSNSMRAVYVVGPSAGQHRHGRHLTIWAVGGAICSHETKCVEAAASRRVRRASVRGRGCLVGWIRLSNSMRAVYVVGPSAGQHQARAPSHHLGSRRRDLQPRDEMCRSSCQPNASPASQRARAGMPRWLDTICLTACARYTS